MHPSSEHLPGRDLPVNDPPPADGSQQPVQDPPDPHPDPTLQQNPLPGLRRIGPDTADPATAIDSEWAEDVNPESHESAV